MALSNALRWRGRASGNNANGGGYDPTTSGVLATTITSAVNNSTTIIPVASASGWPSSGNYYARLGPAAEPIDGSEDAEIVLVTGGQGTTTWTVTRGQLGTSAVAHSNGVAVTNELTAGTTAAWSASDGNSGGAGATATFTSATAGFNATIVGNVLQIASGTNATTGAYAVTGYTNATTITLDRTWNTGSVTAGIFKVGGAWLDPRTNLTSTFLKPGHQFFYRGSGSGSVASPDYTYPDFWTPPGGDNTNGKILFCGEHARPYLKALSGQCLIFYVISGWVHANCYFIGDGAGYATLGIINGGSDPPNDCYNCIFDQNGYDVIGLLASGAVMGCEVWSSTPNSGSAGAQYGIALTGFDGQSCVGCNVHDCWGGGIYAGFMGVVAKCIVAKNKGDGIYCYGHSTHYANQIFDNTIDANGGHGINVGDATAACLYSITGCLITNHTGSGKYGISFATGTQAANDRIRSVIDYNAYYNNSNGNGNAITVGTTGIVAGRQYHDVLLGADPYTAQSTEDYSLTAAAKALGFPNLNFLQSKAGQAAVRSYVDPGAVQRQEAAAGPIIVNATRNVHIGARQ